MFAGAKASSHPVAAWLCITQCAWCRGIKLWSWFLSVPGRRLMTWSLVVRLPLLPVVVIGMTHGVCPECAERVMVRRSRTA